MGFSSSSVFFGIAIDPFDELGHRPWRRLRTGSATQDDDGFGRERLEIGTAEAAAPSARAPTRWRRRGRGRCGMARRAGWVRLRAAGHLRATSHQGPGACVTRVSRAATHRLVSSSIHFGPGYGARLHDAARCRARSTSHPVAARSGCTNIPRAAGGARRGRHPSCLRSCCQATDWYGSPAWTDPG